MPVRVVVFGKFTKHAASRVSVIAMIQIAFTLFNFLCVEKKKKIATVAQTRFNSTAGHSYSTTKYIT